MRKNIYLATTALIILILGLNGCQEDEPAPQLVIPSGLSVEIIVDEIEEGKVEFVATATNANFYTFMFNDGTEDQFIESPDGTIEYVFTDSGTYSINVRANATHDNYSEVTEEVTITFSEPVGNSGNPPAGGYETPLTYPGYTLVWSDEFDGTSLSDDWTYEIGTGSNGWGNQELQYYREENASVSGGNLIIEAREESFGGSNYTSARIISMDKQEFKYGRIDIRAAMPYGQGLWPALWMLGTNFNSVGWPECGEIDIMEMVGGVVTGGGDNVVHGTVHWDNDGTKADFGGKRVMTEPLANNYHVYTLQWDSTQIEWYIDDTRYHTIDITSAALSEFQEEFFFIFNVAVGGFWPGSPNAATKFPQRMWVDYVRVFQEQ